MASNLLSAKIKKPYRIFSKDDLYSIHLATLEVLEETGVKFFDQTILNLLEKSGVIVDKEKKIAKFNQNFVEEMIKKSPSRFYLHGRNPKYDHRIEYKRVYPQVGGECPFVFDFVTNEIRKATLKDLNDLVRLVDGLDYYNNCCLVNPSDVPEASMSPHCTESILNNSEKHGFYGITPESGYEGVLDSINIVIKVVGGVEALIKRHIISSAAFVTSPLMYRQEATMLIRETAKYNIPINIGTNPMAGATSPISLIGTLIQQNAELLAGIILIQLYNPGNPVIYNGFAGIMDMKTGNLSMGSPEQALLSAGTAEIANYYNLPSVFQGCIGESKVWDPQMAYEKTLSAYMSVIAGGNMPMGSGHHDNASIMCAETLVLDNEIWKIILRAVEGITMDDEAFAVDVINEVGPGGNYLGHKHTRNNLLREQYIPELTDRSTREIWRKKGSKNIFQRSKEKVLKILKDHIPEPLEKNIQKEIKIITRKAEKRST